jgi:rhamnulokinase
MPQLGTCPSIRSNIVSAITVAAVDLGAESGRVMRAAFDGRTLRLDEAHRFPNQAVRLAVGDRISLHWDVLRLFHEIKQGIARAAQHGDIAAVGLDTWGVDFALLDSRDRLLGNPHCYRDPRTDGVLDQLLQRVPRAEIFERTGIQFLTFNTIVQMAAMAYAQDPLLDAARTFLTIPDLFNFWLSGRKACEFSNATTTQMYDTRAGAWAHGLLASAGIPSHFLPEVVAPGAVLGELQRAVADELGVRRVPIIAPACHDTGSAVAGAPLRSRHAAYISSGTWSLVGAEAAAPVINAQALAGNFTNEGGVGGTSRVLKNVMGLWLLQESRRTWAAEGREYGYGELAALAADAPPFAHIIDPDDAAFLAPGDMPARIRAWCAERGLPQPGSVAEIARCIFDSLALKYRLVIDALADMLGYELSVVHVVGGGSQNELLCQLTADVAGRPVVAGPVEATAIGNALVQLIALGAVANLDEGRAMVAESFAAKAYEPRHNARVEEAYARFQKLATLA